MDVFEHKEREFAQKLKKCSGCEELDVILKYINWLEEYCPNKGLDAEVIDVLSNTLTKFNEPKYSNDTRYIGLLVKYMLAQTNVLELFQLAYNQNKGIECAVLYCSWASCLIKMKDINTANQVYLQGIEKNAKPSEQLQLDYLLFQVNVGRSVLGLKEFQNFDPAVHEAFAKYRTNQNLKSMSSQSQQDPRSFSQASTSSNPQRIEVSSSKEEFSCPVAYFDPESADKICCYPKKAIYEIENHEYQYEEVLAMRYESRLKGIAENGAGYQEKAKELPAPMTHLPSENPNELRCYPWKEVYAAENQELQLEEVFAIRYEKKMSDRNGNKEREKEKRRSRFTLHPEELANLTRNGSMFQDNDQSKELVSENAAKASFPPPIFPSKENEFASNVSNSNDRSTGDPPQSIASSSTTPEPMGRSAPNMNQSVVTRAVMNLVQDMWKSPSPVAAKHPVPPAVSTIHKSIHTTTKTPFKLYTDQMDVDGSPAQAKSQNPMASSVRKNLHPTTKTPFKLFTDQMEVDGTPNSKENAPTNQRPPSSATSQSGTTISQGKHAFPTAAFPRSQNPFVTNVWARSNPNSEEDQQSKVSSVRPSAENVLTNSANMNQTENREVMNFIQDMWKSPSPVSGSQSVNPVSQSVKIGKGITIFTDDKVDEKKVSTTTVKKVANVGGARPANEMQAFGSRKSLHFGADLKENLNPNFQPLFARGLKPSETENKQQEDVDMMMHDNDFADTTCNTRAFQVPLPSSTPFTRGGNTAAKMDVNNCSILLDGPRKLVNDDLSIIMEASKEKYSSSSGSSSGLRTPFTVKKLHRANNEDIKEETEESQIEKIVSQLTLDENVDPFCPDFVANLLSSINFPQKHHASNIFQLNRDVPNLPHNSTVVLGSKEYCIKSELGVGSYARVLGAITSSSKKPVGLKIQKPACVWEYYIAKEIQTRLGNSPLVQGFMNVDCAFIYKNASIMEMDLAQYGNLLNAVNKVKLASGKPIPVAIATLLSIQLFGIVDHLHKCKIIHGDIKPDNFVMCSLPTSDTANICIKLIDFGRSIDMSLLPDGIEFKRVVKTAEFQCNEMKDGKSWTYQTDYFGLAGTTYLLLMGEYMKVTKRANKWVLQKPLQRYLHRDVWLPIYEELLNVPSCKELPDLAELRNRLQGLLMSLDPTYWNHYLISFANIIQGL